jgi:hypothetical protein
MLVVAEALFESLARSIMLFIPEQALRAHPSVDCDSYVGTAGKQSDSYVGTAGKQSQALSSWIS